MLRKIKTLIVFYAMITQKYYGFTGAWYIAFFLTRVALQGKDTEYITRIISLLHSVLISGLAGYLFFRSPAEEFGSPSDLKYSFVLTLSASYFVYDALIGIQYGILESHFLAHHLIASAALFYGIFSKTSCWEINACLFLMEASNPFYHLNWICDKENFRYGLSYFCNQLAFCTTFFIFRIGFGSVLLMSAISSPRIHKFIKLCAIGLLSINLGFAFVLRNEFIAISHGQMMHIP